MAAFIFKEHSQIRLNHGMFDILQNYLLVNNHIWLDNKMFLLREIWKKIREIHCCELKVGCVKLHKFLLLCIVESSCFFKTKPTKRVVANEVL